jgi:hypothetical protein
LPKTDSLLHRDSTKTGGTTMTFSEAISSGFRNYVGFSGRAARSEFWYWILFTILVDIVTSIIDCWNIVKQCDAALVDLELGHVPAVARDGGAQAARH